MKYEKVIIYVLLLFVSISCLNEKPSRDLINIGDILIPSLLSDSQPALLGIGNEKLNATSGKIENIYVVIVTNTANVITDIFYFDDDFYTPEGYSRKNIFSEISKGDIRKIFKTSYGSTIVYLKSGWKLRFPVKYMGYKQLPPDATPTCIYKGRDEI